MSAPVDPAPITRSRPLRPGRTRPRAPRARVGQPVAPRRSPNTPCGAAKRNSPTSARSPRSPATAPAARRRTSSPSAKPAVADRSTGPRTSRWTRRRSPDSATASAPTSRTANCSSSTASPAPTRDTACRSASSPRRRGTPCSPGACSSGRTAEQLAGFTPEWTILHAVRLPRRPGPRRHQVRSVRRRSASSRSWSSACGTHYAGEIKKSVFTVLNYLLPQTGRLPDALLGERRRGRRRRAVLRPVRHRQDDAVGRPGAPADRRRRTRLGRRRRLQHRGRLLRQDDQALADGRAADLERDPLRLRAGERAGRSAHAQAGLRQQASTPRTRGRPIRSTSSRTANCPASAATRRTSSS